ncbi:hypothetical protein M9Y10_035664 [Tritrichomonas musculus]|uniref:Uncharacterized protein n=1 Tax=Tritrichomonas musculus TaxID=1915356 RepID=A0ABR2GWE5_9EUKA
MKTLMFTIEHSSKLNKNYVVGIFRSNGGSERREHVFHEPFNKPLSFDTRRVVIPINGYV